MAPDDTSPAAPLGLRELKKRRTSDAIRHAATQLFLAKGYEATTVEQIAAAAETSVSTFFRYFPTKEAVLLRTSDGADVVRRGLEQRPEDEAVWTTVSRALLEGLPTAIDYPSDELARIRIAYSTPSVRGAIAAAMAEMEHEMASYIRPHLGRSKDAELDAALMAGALRNAIEVTQDLVISGRAKGDAFALLADALARYGRGMDHITTPKKRKGTR